MSSVLTEFEARIAVFLQDASYAIFTTATIDECLRQILVEYSEANPLATETVITMPGAGREIALDALTGLTVVSDIWYPYDSDGAEVWPPERPAGYELHWDDARPVLVLTDVHGMQPQTGDEMRIFYGIPHTIQNLDSAGVTTVPTEHEALIIRGAAGLAAIAVSSNFIAASKEERENQKTLLEWGLKRMSEFRTQVRKGRQAPASSGGGVQPHWTLDAWDEGEG